MFYYNGLNFVLRGGEEHRQLKISQLKFCNVPNPDDPQKVVECVEYTGSKNRPGGSHQVNLDSKVVTQYAQSELGERCHVFLLWLYLSKLSECAIQDDIFFTGDCVLKTKKPDGEIMKKLQFHEMQGCTFNINVQL